MSFWEVVFGVVASGLGWLVRHYFGDSTWNGVEEAAKVIVKEQGVTPQEAVEKALIQVNLDRLAEAAKKLPDAFKGL